VALRATATNVSFIILLVSFGIVLGSFYAVSTLLNMIVEPAHYSEVCALLPFAVNVPPHFEHFFIIVVG
jgi:hypothetical protein